MSEQTIRCVCGAEVLEQNWNNHLLTKVPRGPHAVFEPSDVLTDEEARLLQRLDLLEADQEAMDSRSGKILATRIKNRLTILAQWPEGQR